MKMPCELIVEHILPTAKAALAKALVEEFRMTQTEVGDIFGVTNAAISQSIKSLKKGNEVIDKSAYRDDFYSMVAMTAFGVREGKPLNEAICDICSYVRKSGMLRALYVFEGYSADDIDRLMLPEVIEIK